MHTRCLFIKMFFLLTYKKHREMLTMTASGQASWDLTSFSLVLANSVWVFLVLGFFLGLFISERERESVQGGAEGEKPTDG